MNIRSLCNDSRVNAVDEDINDPLDVIDKSDFGVRLKMLIDMDPMSKPSTKGTTRSGHGIWETTTSAGPQQPTVITWRDIVIAIILCWRQGFCSLLEACLGSEGGAGIRRRPANSAKMDQWRNDRKAILMGGEMDAIWCGLYDELCLYWRGWLQHQPTTINGVVQKGCNTDLKSGYDKGGISYHTKCWSSKNRTQSCSETYFFIFFYYAVITWLHFSWYPASTLTTFDFCPYDILSLF